MAKTEQNQLIKNLPLFAGITGGFLLMINRLTTPQILDSQARSDALGIILCAVLLLISLLVRQIQPNPPEAVTLIGQDEFSLDYSLPDEVKTELAWASHLLLTNTVTKSIIIYYQNKVLLKRGIFGTNQTITQGKIVQRVIQTQKPVYLVDLKHYPGKIEFDYLPENIQGLICHPLSNNGVMILATNIPRSYTKQDENWIEGIAEKLTVSLNKIN
jgi:hypothetical protein